MNGPHVIGERFTIEKLMGEGGMGEVYYGFDLQTNDPVAIKVLKPHGIDVNPDIVERFRREGEALRDLDHPNIVKMLVAVEEDGQNYIVMEYVEGGSLRDLLQKEGPLPIEQVLHIALDLTDALTRAHRLKIIHRDIKPSNVLLARDGTPRLTDFGAARFEKHQDLTQQGSVLGTVSYLSPEACRAQKLDARTDIWAFGVMLFEMLTGQRPFDEDETSATIIAIVTKPLPDLVALLPDAPPGLVNLIYKMLEKERDERISSMRLVGAELESIIERADSGVRQALDLIYRMLEKDRDQPISSVRLVGGKLQSIPGDADANLRQAALSAQQKQPITLERFESSDSSAKVQRAGVEDSAGADALAWLLSNIVLVGGLFIALIVVVVLILLLIA
jgi:serine/threonine protein kinase